MQVDNFRELHKIAVRLRLEAEALEKQKLWDGFLWVCTSLLGIATLVASQAIHNTHWVFLLTVITVGCMVTSGVLLESSASRKELMDYKDALASDLALIVKLEQGDLEWK